MIVRTALWRLTMFNDEGECGSGAGAPWADRGCEASAVIAPVLEEGRRGPSLHLQAFDRQTARVDRRRAYHGVLRV